MSLVDKVVIACMEVSSADHIYEYEDSVVEGMPSCVGFCSLLACLRNDM